MNKLGIDIGGTKYNIGLLDEANRIVFKCSDKLPSDKTAQAVLAKIKATLDEQLLKHRVALETIESCGIGVPGTVAADHKSVIRLPNLTWENIAFGHEFQALTGIPAYLVQDSRAAAYGEYKAGNGQGCKTVVCITLGTGIGTGIVMDGVIYDGARKTAGELGHIPAVKDGRPCGCGKKGCLEKYAAGRGLDITAESLYGEGHTASDLFDRALSGDAKAASVISDAVELLGNALVALVNIMSPDCLLFSGGMCEQEELFIRPLTAYIQAHCYSAAPGDSPYISRAALGPDAPMVGAALYSASRATSA